MKDIAIYGAGGLGREVACLIRMINEKGLTWNLIGFFDDNKNIGNKNEYGKILGGINELNVWKEPLSIVIAIGNPTTVKRIVDNIQNRMIEFPNIIAPSVTFLDKANVSIGKGNIICSECLFSINIKIGDFNLFNGFITVGHDVTIGNFNTIMPAVRISGEVRIGCLNFLGIGAVVLQQIQIGDNTRIGANSLIIRNTKDGNTYFCPPAEIL